MGNKDIQKIRRIEAREKNIRSFLRKVPHNLRGFNIVENLEQGSDFTYLSPDDKTVLVEYLDKPSPFLILSGGSGLGKSATAIGLAFELMRRGYAMTAKYVSTSILLNEFSFGDGTEDRMRPLKKAMHPDILILDDVSIGSTLSTETKSGTMQALIAKRWEEGKYTIITTDLKVEAENNKEKTNDKQEGEYEYNEEDRFTIQQWFGEASWNKMSGKRKEDSPNMMHAHFSNDASVPLFRNNKKSSRKKKGLSKLSVI